MKIVLERHGGFHAPAMRSRIEVDSASLPAADAGELKRLVDQSGLLAGAPDPPPPRATPDARVYVLSIEDGGASRRVAVGQADVPEGLQGLVDWLGRRPS